MDLLYFNKLDKTLYKEHPTGLYTEILPRGGNGKKRGGGRFTPPPLNTQKARGKKRNW